MAFPSILFAARRLRRPFGRLQSEAGRQRCGMAFRLTSAPVFGFAGLGAALAVVGVSWSDLVGRQATPEAVVVIAHRADPLAGLIPPPELPAERIVIEAGILSTEPTTFAAFYSGSAPPLAFSLRPALSDHEAASRFDGLTPPAAAEMSGAPSAEALAVVNALPPPRPSLEAAASAADSTLAILAVRPPARPKLASIKLASIDAAIPVGSLPEAAPDTAAQPDGAARPAGFGGLFGSWARQDLQVSPTTPAFRDDGKGQRGMASWYGPRFHGRKTANGERFDQMAMTAAHRTLPFGTKVRVVDDSTGRSVVVRINDRGPYAHGRIIDLSKGSAQALGIGGQGVMRVRLVSADE